MTYNEWERRMNKASRQASFALFGMIIALFLAAITVVFTFLGDFGPALLFWVLAVGVGLPFKRYGNNVRKKNDSLSKLKAEDLD